jgi:hypothetical protein
MIIVNGCWVFTPNESEDGIERLKMGKIWEAIGETAKLVYSELRAQLAFVFGEFAKRLGFILFPVLAIGALAHFSQKMEAILSEICKNGANYTLLLSFFYIALFNLTLAFICGSTKYREYTFKFVITLLAGLFTIDLIRAYFGTHKLGQLWPETTEFLELLLGITIIGMVLKPATDDLFGRWFQRVVGLMSCVAMLAVVFVRKQFGVPDEAINHGLVVTFSILGPVAAIMLSIGLYRAKTRKTQTEASATVPSSIVVAGPVPVDGAGAAKIPSSAGMPLSADTSIAPEAPALASKDGEESAG